MVRMAAAWSRRCWMVSRACSRARLALYSSVSICSLVRMAKPPIGLVRALATGVDDVAVAVADEALAPAVSAADGDGPSAGAGDDGMGDAFEQRTALTARAVLAVRAVGLVVQGHSVSAAPVS